MHNKTPKPNALFQGNGQTKFLEEQQMHLATVMPMDHLVISPQPKLDPFKNAA